jgi:hypothetical protein
VEIPDRPALDAKTTDGISAGEPPYVKVSACCDVPIGFDSALNYKLKQRQGLRYCMGRKQTPTPRHDLTLNEDGL